MTIFNSRINDYKSAITVYPTAVQTFKTAATKIAMGAVFGKFGNAFKLSDGGVLVNKDCIVEVSGNIYASGALVVNDTLAVQINKNGTLVSTVCIDRASVALINMQIPPIVMSCEQGDVIHLYAYNSTSARGNLPADVKNRLTIKEI